MLQPHAGCSLTSHLIQVENVLQGCDGRWKICDMGSCVTRAQAYDNKSEIAREEVRCAVVQRFQL